MNLYQIDYYYRPDTEIFRYFKTSFSVSASPSKYDKLWVNRKYELHLIFRSFKCNMSWSTQWHFKVSKISLVFAPWKTWILATLYIGHQRASSHVQQRSLSSKKSNRTVWGQTCLLRRTEDLGQCSRGSGESMGFVL